ncbi:hypothetical protein Hanom_Chr17g01539581 [Helianthus anomalus]
MSKSTALLVISASIFVIDMLTLSFPAVEAARDHHIGWIPTIAGTGSSGCRGSMAECLVEGGDLDIDDMQLSLLLLNAITSGQTLTNPVVIFCMCSSLP